MQSIEYKVELELFSGPLDLLLYLVRRNEVDILDLPISTITGQFAEFLEVLEFLDLDLVGDFIVVASALMEIKSREVLPHPEEERQEEPIDEEDPDSDLIRQLLEYKKFKDASKILEERAAEWQERYPRLSDDRPSRNKDPKADRIKEVELWDLVSALARVLKRQEVERHTRIRYDETPISVYIKQIGERVRQDGRIAFSAFFEGTNQKSRIVSTFLAILELIRHHSFRAEQPDEFGEIWILPPLEISVTDAG